MRCDACDDFRSVEDYRNYLLLLVRVQLGPRLRAKVDASDVVQQAILHAHERRAQFRGTTEGEWQAWLRAILANALAAMVRRCERAVRGEELLRLAHALTELPDDQRRVVELHYLKGLAVADVAEQIGRTRPAAVGLLFRGLKRLRELLRDPVESSHES
jgi:RNA polymerase sigma-70 factor (ECF subfamily)